MSYDTWHDHIDYQSKHRRLQPQKSVWNDPRTIYQSFQHLIDRHQKSILVISYRDDGIPSKEQLVRLLRQYKNQVYEASQPKQYALAHKQSQELLLIGI
jgi:adenine-specific DNA methylase